MVANFEEVNWKIEENGKWYWNGMYLRTQQRRTLPLLRVQPTTNADLQRNQRRRIYQPTKRLGLKIYYDNFFITNWNFPFRSIACKAKDINPWCVEIECFVVCVFMAILCIFMGLCMAMHIHFKFYRLLSKLGRFYIE